MNIEIIQKYNKEEIKDIIALCDDAFVEPISQLDNFDLMLNKLSDFSVFLAAYIENEIVGYAAFYANDMENKISYLTLIGIKPKFQSMGIGYQLLNYCEKESINRGMLQMKLEVKKYNENAIRFYQKHGFVYLCEHDENSFYMLKSLSWYIAPNCAYSSIGGNINLSVLLFSITYMY